MIIRKVFKPLTKNVLIREVRVILNTPNKILQLRSVLMLFGVNPWNKVTKK